MSVQPQPVRYYDLPPEEEELSQAFIHYLVIKILSSILEQHLQNTNFKLASSINIYYPDQDAVAPDLAVIENLVLTGRSEKKRRSYYVGEGNPPPSVAFEIASEETWERDLKQKLVRYERMGTQEYYVFDPNVPQVWGREWRQKGRLLGWWLNPFTLKLEEVPVGAEGRLWSKELDSWLGIELEDSDPYLRLYEKEGTRRLTVEEAREAERAKVLVERRAKLAAEKREATAKKSQADALQAKLAAEKREADALQAKLAAEKREADALQRLQQLENELQAKQQRIKELEK